MACMGELKVLNTCLGGRQITRATPQHAGCLGSGRPRLRGIRRLRRGRGGVHGAPQPRSLIEAQVLPLRGFLDHCSRWPTCMKHEMAVKV